MATYDYLHSNSDVTAMQNVLVKKGYLKDTDIDGYWGPKTAKAVRAMQADLKNAGKYTGNIDGAWGDLTDQAVAAAGDFTASNPSTNKTKPQVTASNSTQTSFQANNQTLVTDNSQKKESSIPKEYTGLGQHIYVGNGGKPLKNRYGQVINERGTPIWKVIGQSNFWQWFSHSPAEREQLGIHLTGT